jgi:hypothetical protein
MIAHTIQLALAPVFLLVAIGNIMNILSTRLGRTVDRARRLQELHGATNGDEHDRVVAEIRSVDRRIRLITRAMRWLVMGGLAIGITVAILFLEEIAGYRLEKVAAAFFLVAIALLMWGLTLFLHEIQIAAASLRIRKDFLELDRDL